MIERRVYEKAQNYIKKKEILTIVGARQVGKTTIMQKLFDENNSKKIFF